jgi:nitrite reductase/ring-hydroxylating ferredoxin subunit
MTTNVFSLKKNTCPRLEEQAFSAATMTELASLRSAGLFALHDYCPFFTCLRDEGL